MRKTNPTIRFTVTNAFALAVIASLFAANVFAGQAAPAADERDGRAYPVSRIDLVYGSDHPQHPPVDPIYTKLRVRLVATPDGYTAARSAEAGTSLSLAELNARPADAPAALYGSAIQLIARRVVAHYNDRGFIGITVGPHPEDIDAAANDRRPAGQTALRMVIRIGVVGEMRTVAAGERVPQADRINHPKHSVLIDESPVAPGTDEQPDDLLNKDEIDAYIAFLNRHPGRRIDAAISPGVKEGTVAMDYLVTENKPWAVFYQLSNTGTQETAEWRHRFGFIDYQFTNNDDILQIDYITAGFDEAHAVLVSYEAPLIDRRRLRYKVYGSWSKFTASDVGIFDDRFEGEGWGVGGDLILNIFQHEELFVDLVGGVRWQHEEVTNDAVDTFGEDDFFLPHVGLVLERFTERSATYASVDFEWNLSGVAGTDSEEIDKLGRLMPEKDYQRMQWDVMHSFYLEPLLNGPNFNDTTTPDSSTLAHELVFMFRGQHAFGDRLIPQAERPAGGGFSVRGYPESIVAGDNAYIFTAEYRFHIPRVFAIEPDARKLFGQPFRYAPQNVYGRTDWDLIFRTFVDYARVEVNDKLLGESDEDLLGAGVGLEVLYRRNINFRVDWGIALNEVDGLVTEGSQRFHFVLTLLY